ncbi:4-hydroxy-tetrahydrodipicolinate reductase [Desulfurispirillum indicum]|uniref:4-hydroxy-tetrahydrodipicolinate reductase n=1 Tax=Desulfurispirillum indicum (strain ATCC BAA-1389 / DSM 22839 / S5) TaxID=653733 RepID=E6W4S9_DESIS|nr:4-hydroxy-tetrahydrodipicolinate reductase [Desulfurispirillum indicum]ADU64807.1 dihydrodipicolinate reductase [Desulfurispirillum indicum S5]UCZ56741.1 4-hydroxy-tetrahydrodipicolinate reductase [Desulfurispirillum indicum]
MLKIAIMGVTGRMGTTILNLVEKSDHCQLAAAIDAPTSPYLGKDSGEIAGFGTNGIVITDDLEAALSEADVVIDFTHADATAGNAPRLAKIGIPLVIGTTGLSAEGQAAINAAAQHIPIVFAPNMSTGVNVTLKLLEMAATIFGDDYDVEVVEAHHNRKKDAPSGTAMKMAQVLAQTLKRDLATDAVYHREGMIGERTKKEIGIQTIRGGDIVGDHTVFFCGPGERVEITHRAHSRDTFASGAIRAATWVHHQPAGLYSMFDVLGLK